MWSVWSVGCSCLCCDWSAMKKTKFQHSKSCSEGCPLQPVWAFREEVFIFDWFSASPAPPKWWCHSLHCSGFGRRPRRTSVVCETFSIMRLKGLTGSLYQPQIIRHVCLSRKSQTNQRNEGFSPLSLTCSVTELWCKNTFEPNSVVFASYCRECPFIMELHYPAALVQSCAYQLSCLLWFGLWLITWMWVWHYHD